jgi:hypothetical protein
VVEQHVHEVTAQQTAEQAPDGEILQRLRVKALSGRCAHHQPSREQHAGRDEDAEDLKGERPQRV